MGNIITTEKFKELIQPISPVSQSWSVDGGQAQATFIINAEDFFAFVIEILGGVEWRADNTLNRYIPMSLPSHPYLYASRIVSFEGMAQDGRATTESFSSWDAFYQLDKKVLEYAGVYKVYRITVEFSTRPYRILTNDNLSAMGFQQKDQWFIKSNQPAGQPIEEVNVPFTDRYEWCRQTTVSESFEPVILTNNLGAWYYKTIANVDTTGPSNNAGITTQEGSGSNLTQMRKIVRIKWWFVPYSTINNINFHNAYGKINRTEFFGYQAGSLLFKNIEIESYSSPYPIETIQISTNPMDLSTAYLKNRYCDLTFVFEEFTVPNDQKGSTPIADYRFLNGKIKDGHNLMPYSGNNLYYYVENNTDKTIALPPMWSYDFRQLFLYEPYINPI